MEVTAMHNMDKTAQAMTNSPQAEGKYNNRTNSPTAKQTIIHKVDLIIRP